MATTADIRQIAAEVRENANDLRMMEVLTNWIYAENGRMPYAGDSDADDWDMYRANIPSRESVIQEYEQRYGVVAGTEFDHIPPLIESYGTELASHEAMLDVLTEATRSLSGAGPAAIAQDEYNTIAINGDLDAWQGTFAREFKGRVIGKMAAVQGEQHNVLCELQAAVMAHKEMASRTNDAVYEIGVATRNALVDAIHARVAKTEGAIGWEIVGLTLGIGLSVAGLVLAPAAGGLLAVSIMSTATGAATGIVGTVKSTTATVVGDQVDVIMGSMHEAIALLAQDVDRAEKELAEILASDLRELEALLAKPASRETFEGVRPHLADERP
ncbi:MAG TPA: hypothetical protein VGF17_09865, partial [Phytomonospora sp.]